MGQPQGPDIAPPGEEKHYLPDWSKSTYTLISITVGLFVGYMTGYSGGLNDAQNKVLASKPAESRPVSVPAPQDAEPMLIELDGFQEFDLRGVAADLDALGLRPASSNEFIAWGKGTSQVDRQKFHGDIITFAVPASSEPIILGLGYFGDVYVAKKVQYHLKRHRPILLVVSKSAPAYKDEIVIKDAPDSSAHRTVSRDSPIYQSRFFPIWPPSNTEIEFAAKSMVMGRNFISCEEVEKHSGVKFSDDDLSVLFEGIPSTPKVLKECKDTHILVPMPALSIMEIRALVPAGTFWDSNWYNDEAFANGEKCRPGWHLIRKTAVPDSTGKCYDEQVALLGSEEEVPPACELVYAAVISKLVRDDKLFSRGWVRSSSLSSAGCRVHVSFCGDGLVIDDWCDVARYDDLGVASSRKFPQK